MALNHQVKQGDCISSIAFENGFFPDTIWDHPQNKELKAKRKDPNVLMPGDMVFVPDKRVKEVSEATDQVHKYVIKNVPAKFRLKILSDDEPRRNEPFVLNVDGAVSNGVTTSEGIVEAVISPDARKATLIVGSGEEETVYRLRLGRLDPHDEIRGVQGRLNNLGFLNSRVDGELNDETKKAIAAFQSAHGLAATGEPDEQTKAKLKGIEGGQG